MNRHAPMKKLSRRQVKFNNKPWIINHIQKMINIKNKLFYRQKRQPNNENIKLLYNQFPNRVNRGHTV